jgi:hypothetical protein
MRRTVIFVLIALGFGVASSPAWSGANAVRSPRVVAVETVWQNIRGQYGLVWRKLHPRYKTVTTREKWESCQRRRANDTADVEWLSIRATHSYADRLRFPLLGRTRVAAVTVAARIRSPLLGTRTITDTVYYTRIGTRWYGIWEPETYNAYRRGRCPA